MKRAIGRRGLRIGVLVTALLALAGGIAYATIPDSNGVFTACKLNATGTIRLIDPSLGSTSLLGHCTSLETQISWNQQGQAGKDGASVKSADAETLAAGSAASASFDPASGNVHFKIPKGDKGDKGDQGPQGPSGSTGPVADTFVAENTSGKIFTLPGFGDILGECGAGGTTSTIKLDNINSYWVEGWTIGTAVNGDYALANSVSFGVPLAAQKSALWQWVQMGGAERHAMTFITMSGPSTEGTTTGCSFIAQAVGS
jgi:hypothetical protein